MKTLITGGAGYIGSVLTPELLLAGYKVTVLDSLLFNQFSLASCVASPNFEFVHGDCRNAELIGTLTKKADVIIPLAAVVGAPLCNRDPYTAQTTNEEAVKMLCRTLSPKQRIILPVTNSGYGIGAKSKKCDENFPLRPISLYNRTKVEAEKVVLERNSGIKVNRKRLQRLRRKTGIETIWCSSPRHEHSRQRAQEIPVSAEGSGRGIRRQSLVCGHHVYPDAVRAHSLERDDGLAFPQGAGVGK